MNPQLEVTAREKCIYGEHVEILSRDDDATVYRLINVNGETLMNGYNVLPGIKLIYNDVHLQYEHNLKYVRAVSE